MTVTVFATANSCSPSGVGNLPVRLRASRRARSSSSPRTRSGPWTNSRRDSAWRSPRHGGRSIDSNRRPFRFPFSSHGVTDTVSCNTVIGVRPRGPRPIQPTLQVYSAYEISVGSPERTGREARTVLQVAGGWFGPGYGVSAEVTGRAAVYRRDAGSRSARGGGF